ncbi:MAG: ROK family protein, partial [Sedimentisphaerales bacterium]|nr:ROK family protein [Sedimentisphaerales bacterium]
MVKQNLTKQLYVGVDVGGTKIQASLIREDGTIIASLRCPTPHQAAPDQILTTIEKAVRKVLKKGKVEASSLAAFGIAVPGVVDPKKGKVIVTPNMNFSGAKVVKYLEDKFPVQVVLGNDCNLGTLGEAWL